MLRHKGLTVSEIAFAVGISERLAQEYLDLYERYDIAEYQARMAEIVQVAGGGTHKPTETHKRGAR
jgi:hypothetical protein